jgi:hypothetical protein
MRAAIVLSLAMALPAPAIAQDFNTIFLENQMRAEQDMARQRGVALQNELMALDARIRTEQTIRDVQAQGRTVRLPTPQERQPPPPSRPPPFDAGQVASIPDQALAASNARVREAAGNRR